MQNKSQNYKDVFEKSNITNNKANSTKMSSAQKTINGFSKIHQWQDGLKSHSGYQRMQTMADIAATIIAGGSGG